MKHLLNIVFAIPLVFLALGFPRGAFIVSSSAILFLLVVAVSEKPRGLSGYGAALLAYFSAVTFMAADLIWNIT